MREYDFSTLSKPLHKCSRTYCHRRLNERVEVLLVQDEDDIMLDKIVYASTELKDAKQAACELNAMIRAAKVLHGSRV